MPRMPPTPAPTPAIKYRVTLTDDEVEMLEALLRKGRSAARKQTRARILLKAAAGGKDAEIMGALAVSATMIYNTRQRGVEEGVEAALHDRPRPGKTPKLTDKQCAQAAHQDRLRPLYAAYRPDLPGCRGDSRRARQPEYA